MNIFKRFIFRTYQKGLYLASFFLNFSEPIVTTGEGCSKEVYKAIKEMGKSHPLIVTDDSLYKLGLLDFLIKGLEENNVLYSIYKDVRPNPTTGNVENALSIYKGENCDSIIAFGGGSSIDTAKVVGALVSNPKKNISKLKGLLKISKKYKYFIAVPTTAGTGSEATVAAVIVDEKNHDKYAINDPKLIPSYAFLDPTLLLKLPSKITSTTGMDALTHAIESYIGKSGTKKTKKYALESIQLINKNLLNSYNNPDNVLYRENMLIASYKAGVSFTRAYVGYVHAIAHSLGGLYNIPHGYANAILLPIILKHFGSSVYSSLARIYDYINNDNKDINKAEKAKAVISYIEELNEKMGILPDFSYIKEEDIDFLARHSYKEANPLYPVPKEFDLKDFVSIIEELRNYGKN